MNGHGKLSNYILKKQDFYVVLFLYWQMSWLMLMNLVLLFITFLLCFE